MVKKETVPEKPILNLAKMKDDKFFQELFEEKQKPKFHLDKLLLWLFWIILIGLFLYLCQLVPVRIMDRIIKIALLFGLLMLIRIFIREIFEVDILWMFKR